MMSIEAVLLVTRNSLVVCLEEVWAVDLRVSEEILTLKLVEEVTEHKLAMVDKEEVEEVEAVEETLNN
jgi:hypothetical protein